MPDPLYSELTPRYHLVDPAPAHADEGACYEAVFVGAIEGPARTWLDLGPGAGNNASHPWGARIASRRRTGNR